MTMTMTMTMTVTISTTPFCDAPSPSGKSSCYLNRGHFEPNHYAPCPDHGDWCTDHPSEEWPRSPLVLNIHSDPPAAVSAGVYIGRPSIWGNPFQIGKDGDRAQVISKYRRWLQKQPDLIERMKRELKGRDLVCYCAPLMCHGDVILEVANS